MQGYRAVNQEFDNQSYWQDAWTRHIETYLAAPPRCGHWLAANFSNKQLTFVEVAGGSCRDSRYLAHRGYTAVGTDFDERTLDYLRKRFPDSPLPLQREDAFGFSFADKSFDVSFSNGFWVCFASDEQLYSLAREQERITRKYLIILVHNAENDALIELFREKAKSDSLYDVRFFYRDELREVIDTSGIRCKRMTFGKFGGPMDRLYSSRIKRLPNPLRKVAHHVVPRLYRYQSWRSTERIACIIELE
jgi:hypothetical protein